MTLFRNLVDGRLYKMYKTKIGKTISSTPYIIEDFITGETKNVPQYMMKKLIPAYDYK